MRVRHVVLHQVVGAQVSQHVRTLGLACQRLGHESVDVEYFCDCILEHRAVDFLSVTMEVSMVRKGVQRRAWRAQVRRRRVWSTRNLGAAWAEILTYFKSPQCAIDCLRALQDVICSSHVEVATDNFLPTVSESSEITILLFDGGSRGNPGPGGACSVLVKVCPMSRSARIIWFGSMSYVASATTNNSAEYQGLIHGLRAAHTKQLHQLEVIGDSAMVLRPMRLYRPPKKERLRELYVEARYLGDMICIKRWHHHYRRHNKMADLAANFAMDRRFSVQTDWPTDRSPIPAIEESLVNDLVPWFAQLEDQYASSVVGEDPA